MLISNKLIISWPFKINGFECRWVVVKRSYIVHCVINKFICSVDESVIAIWSKKLQIVSSRTHFHRNHCDDKNCKLHREIKIDLNHFSLHNHSRFKIYDDWWTFYENIEQNLLRKNERKSLALNWVVIFWSISIIQNL